MPVAQGWIESLMTCTSNILDNKVLILNPSTSIQLWPSENNQHPGILHKGAHQKLRTVSHILSALSPYPAVRQYKALASTSDLICMLSFILESLTCLRHQCDVASLSRYSKFGLPATRLAATTRSAGPFRTHDSYQVHGHAIDDLFLFPFGPLLDLCTCS